MNRLTKLFGGLVAALALVAYVAVPGMAQADDNTDQAEITVTTEQILLYQFSNGGDLTFDFTESQFSAGQATHTITKASDGSDWTTNVQDTQLELCVSSQFSDLTQGDGSQSYVVAGWPGNANSELKWAYAVGPAASSINLVADQGDGAENGSGLGSNEYYDATDCDATDDTGTLNYPLSTAPSAGTHDPQDTSEAYTEVQYHVADGNFSSDSATVQATLTTY